jgi:hypothetical protein
VVNAYELKWCFCHFHWFSGSLHFIVISQADNASHRQYSHVDSFSLSKYDQNTKDLLILAILVLI